MDINVLNLHRSRDRWKHFNHVNRHISSFIRVEAVDGTLLDREKLIRDKIISPDLNWKMGTIGCALSHKTLWEQSVIEQKALTISEDDALFSYFFMERTRGLLEQIGTGWDFVMWGYGLRHYIWVDLVPHLSSTEIRLTESGVASDLHRYQFTPPSATLMKLLHAFTTLCYSISPSGATKMLARCFPLRPELIKFQDFNITIQNDGIDCVANAVYPQMNSFICVGPLAVVDSTTHSVRQTIDAQSVGSM